MFFNRSQFAIFGFLLFLLLAGTPASAQQNKVDRFIAEYKTFVDEVVATPVRDIHGDTLEHIKHQQHKFMRRYRWHYDKRMSVEQLEAYNRLCGRYHRKMRQVSRQRNWAVARGRIEGRFDGLFHSRDSIETPVDTVDN